MKLASVDEKLRRRIIHVMRRNDPKGKFHLSKLTAKRIGELTRVTEKNGRRKLNKVRKRTIETNVMYFYFCKFENDETSKND